MLLIQVGGLGVMTITSFFALFFIGIEYNATVVVNTTEDDQPLEPDDVLVCYGKESDFRKLCRL